MFCVSCIRFTRQCVRDLRVFLCSSIQYKYIKMYIILPFTVLNGTHLQFISIYHNEHKPCRYECHAACVKCPCGCLLLFL